MKKITMALMLALVACATAFTSCNNDDDPIAGNYYALLTLIEDGQQLNDAQKTGLTNLLNKENAVLRTATVSKEAAESLMKTTNMSDLGTGLQKDIATINTDFTGSKFKIKYYFTDGSSSTSNVIFIFEDGKFKTHSN